MSEEITSYDESHITVLHAWEGIRKRPGMYVGSTGERGLHRAVYEVVGRPVNEVLAGRATSVDVTLAPDGGVSVADDGPGVPVEADEDGFGLEALLTSAHSGGQARGRDLAYLDMVGLGPYVTNALSSRLTAEVRRDGTRWVQEYTRGVAAAPPTAVGAADGSGTTLTFRPDPDIFETVECSFAVLEERFRELAFLNRRLAISMTDTRLPGEPRSVRFRFPGGARDFVAFLDAPARTPVHPDVIAFEWEDERMQGRAEVALRWCASREERLRSFANSCPTHGGGAHVSGFRDGAAAALNAYARKQRLLSAAETDLGVERICEGLTAVVSVKLDRLEFEGATRSVLGNTAVSACVGEAVREHLGRWLEEHPEQAAAVVARFLQDGSRS
ncbi:DNA gyrase subunit B [Streptomyces sp. NPDC088354]|uniref:DNA gyrase subunit B n=1 Tax=Streptomyces sp. NPDC088354 TaxID=3365856 RepID=UPI00381267B6